MIHDQDMMQFLTLVSRMRFYQGLYFRSRSSVTLAMAREAEDLVDDQLKQFEIEFKIEPKPQTIKIISLCNP